jgi:outer membrane lipoprotein SlyB
MKLMLVTALAAALMDSAQAQTQAAPDPTDVNVPTAAQLAQLCDGCAWVQQVRVETRKKASGLGTVGGAVLGGLLGKQVGGGDGKKLATVGGAVAGGLAGNEVEKTATASTVWDVLLVDQTGGMRHVTLTADPQVQPGDAVRHKDGQLLRP